MISQLTLGLADAGAETTTVLSEFVFPSQSSPHLSSFLVLVAVGAGALSIGVRTSPIIELAPRGAAQRYATYQQRVRKKLHILAGGALLVGGGVFFAFGASSRVVYTQFPPWAYRLLVGLTTTHILRTILVWVIIISVFLAGFLWLLIHTTRLVRHRIMTWLGILGISSLYAFIGATIVVPKAAPIVEETLRTNEFAHRLLTLGTEPVTLGLTAVPVVVVVALILVISIVHVLGSISDRVTGPALTSLGFYLSAMIVGVQHTDSVAVFGLVVCAVLAWDVGEFGIGLVEEIKIDTQPASLERSHASVSFAIAAVASLGLFGIYTVLSPISAPNTVTTIAILAATSATALLLLLVRG